MAHYNFLNNPRNIILDIIFNEFENEINDGKVVINEFGDIPVDYKPTDDDCLMVFYVQKINNSYEENYPFDENYENANFTIGIRSCEEISDLNGRVAEDYIYRLWRFLRYTDQAFCGYIISVTNEHYLLTKDDLTRYFWEFDLNLRNR